MDMLPVGISKKYTNRKIQEVIGSDNDLSDEIVKGLAQKLDYKTDGLVDPEKLIKDLKTVLADVNFLSEIATALEEI
jgi:hypothetical protein